MEGDEDKNERVITLETGGKAMKEGKSISITVVGLVSGLFSMVPAALAKDRHDIARVEAAEGTFSTIDFPDATFTAALDINSAGKIVGVYVSAGDGNNHGFLRNRHGEFTTIDFPGADFSRAAGINSRGDMVGFYRLRGEAPMARHGFLLSKGTFTTIDPPGSVFTNALGINRRGDIVGRYCTVLPCMPENRHGFLRSGGEFWRIDVPGAVGTNAWGINDRGKIVGGYQGADGKSHVYLLREGQLTTIDFPGAVDTAPRGDKGGINSRGDIVSYYCAFEPCSLDNDSEHGFLLSDGEFTTIDFPDAHAAAAFGINARGDIVGPYNDASGNGHGFLLNPEKSDEDED
jgi:uncharacterized membrane protein